MASRFSARIGDGIVAGIAGDSALAPPFARRLTALVTKPSFNTDLLLRL
jgi:hypothetical protein